MMKKEQFSSKYTFCEYEEFVSFCQKIIHYTPVSNFTIE